jgi:hypothetical protein
VREAVRQGRRHFVADEDVAVSMSILSLKVVVKDH